MADRRQQIGRIGEQAATWLLRRRLYRIVARNYRCSAGEIDIIARRWRTLCFVEVRTRSGSAHGSAVEMVTETKQRQVVRTARYFLHEHRIEHLAIRFDVVGITVDRDGKVLDREWIANAFDADV